MSSQRKKRKRLNQLSLVLRHQLQEIQLRGALQPVELQNRPVEHPLAVKEEEERLGATRPEVNYPLAPVEVRVCSAMRL